MNPPLIAESDLDEACDIAVEDFQKHAKKCISCSNAEPVMPLYDMDDKPEGLCSTGSRLANLVMEAEQAYERAMDESDEREGHDKPPTHGPLWDAADQAKEEGNPEAQDLPQGGK